MAQKLPAGLFLDARDAVVLDAVLRPAVAGIAARHGAVPRNLVEIAEEVHRVAGKFRANVLIEPGPGTVVDDFGSVTAASPVTDELLSVAEVARIAGCSEEFIRRQARQGALKGAKCGARGAWKLTATSAALWVASRSNTDDQTAA